MVTIQSNSQTLFLSSSRGVWSENKALSVQLPALAEGEALASPLVSDVDSDGQLDILMPVS